MLRGVERRGEVPGGEERKEKRGEEREEKRGVEHTLPLPLLSHPLAYLPSPPDMKHITHDVETMLSCCVNAINEAPLHAKERNKRKKRKI